MAVPGFQEFMLPMLKIFGDKKEHKVSECTNEISKLFKFTDEELSEKI